MDPPTVTGGQESTGTVVLTGVAPAGGILVPLAASPPGTVRLPRAVTVPEGARHVSFSVETSAVAVNTSVQITAGSSGNTRSLTLALLSPEPTVGPGTVFVMPLVTHDMVYDPHRRLIYASLPAGPDGARSIAVIGTRRLKRAEGFPGSAGVPIPLANSRAPH